MLRVYGWLSQVCGSVALAALLLSMVAVVTHSAFAEDPLPVPAIICVRDCSCTTQPQQPCYYGTCRGFVVGCDTQCGCTGSDAGVDCYCTG
jgi:hypothetical protein